jgi:hypothetical protein
MASTHAMVVLAATLCCATAAAQEPSRGSALPTVFGIAMGQPLGLQACAEFGVHREALPEHEGCFVMPEAAAAGYSGDAEVMYRDQLVPHWLMGSVLRVELRGGVAGRLIAHATNATPEDLLADVQRKFGEPSSRNVRAVRSAAGVKLTRINAVWQRAGYTVKLHAIGGAAGSGTLEVVTQAHARAQQRELRESRASRQPM